MRTEKQATLELYDPLKKLETDYFDLYQLHGIITTEEVKQIFAPNGAFESFIEAKRKGLIRYIGFSAHTEEAAIALIDLFNFNSILLPFN